MRMTSEFVANNRGRNETRRYTHLAFPVRFGCIAGSADCLKS